MAALTHQFGDLALAEDLAQDALVRACDRWSEVGRLSSPIGWTFRVGVNLGNSWFRRRAAERRARHRHGADADVHRDPDVADRLAVRQALQRLTTTQREAVVLAELSQTHGGLPGLRLLDALIWMLGSNSRNAQAARIAVGMAEQPWRP